MTEDTSVYVCNSGMLSVVMKCEYRCPINPITNQNPIYRHFIKKKN
jgi:hypothetical protein